MTPAPKAAPLQPVSPTLAAQLRASARRLNIAPQAFAADAIARAVQAAEGRKLHPATR